MEFKWLRAFSIENRVTHTSADVDLELETFAGGEDRVLRGSVRHYSALIRNDSGAEVTVGITPSLTMIGAQLDIWHVLSAYKDQSQWTHYSGTYDPEGRQMPTLLLKDVSKFRHSPITGENSDVGTTYVTTDDLIEHSLNPRPAAISPSASNHGQSVDANDVPMPFTDAAELQPVTIPAGQCRQVWVRIKVPPTAESGSYPLTLTLDTVGAETVTVNLSVPAYSWQKSNLKHRMYNLGTPRVKNIADNWDTSATRRSPEKYARDLALMQDWGTTEIGSLGVAPYVSGEDESITSEDFKEGIREHFRNGWSMDTFISSMVTSNTSEIDSWFFKRLDLADQFLKELEQEDPPIVFNHWRVYGHDESSLDNIQVQKDRYWDIILTDPKYSRWEIMQTIGSSNSAGNYREDRFAACNGYVTELVNARAPSNYWVDQIKDFNPSTELYCYACPQSGHMSPHTSRQYFGWSLMSSKLIVGNKGYDGVLHFILMKSFGSMWRSHDYQSGSGSSFYDHVMCLDTTDATIPYLAFAGWQQAIYDAGVIAMLEAAITNPPPGKEADAEAARTWLEGRYAWYQDISRCDPNGQSPYLEEFPCDADTEEALNQYEAIMNQAVVTFNEGAPLTPQGLLLEATMDMQGEPVAQGGTNGWYADSQEDTSITKDVPMHHALRPQTFVRTGAGLGRNRFYTGAYHSEPVAGRSSVGCYVSMEDGSEPRNGSSTNANSDMWVFGFGEGTSQSVSKAYPVGGDVYLLVGETDSTSSGGTTGLYQYEGQSGKNFTFGHLCTYNDVRVQTAENAAIRSPQYDELDPVGDTSCVYPDLSTVGMGVDNGISITVVISMPPWRPDILNISGGIFCLPAGAGNEGIEVVIDRDTPGIHARCVTSSGTADILFSGPTFTYPLTIKVEKDGAGFRAWLNDVEGTADTNRTEPLDAALTELRLGEALDGANGDALFLSAEMGRVA